MDEECEIVGIRLPTKPTLSLDQTRGETKDTNPLYIVIDGEREEPSEASSSSEMCVEVMYEVPSFKGANSEPDQAVFRESANEDEFIEARMRRVEQTSEDQAQLIRVERYPDTNRSANLEEEGRVFIESASEDEYSFSSREEDIVSDSALAIVVYEAHEYAECLHRGCLVGGHTVIDSISEGKIGDRAFTESASEDEAIFPSQKAEYSAILESASDDDAFTLRETEAHSETARLYQLVVYEPYLNQGSPEIHQAVEGDSRISRVLIESTSEDEWEPANFCSLYEAEHENSHQIILYSSQEESEVNTTEQYQGVSRLANIETPEQEVFLESASEVEGELEMQDTESNFDTQSECRGRELLLWHPSDVIHIGARGTCDEEIGKEIEQQGRMEVEPAIFYGESPKIPQDPSGQPRIGALDGGLLIEADEFFSTESITNDEQVESLEMREVDMEEEEEESEESEESEKDENLEGDLNDPGETDYDPEVDEDQEDCYSSDGEDPGCPDDGAINWEHYKSVDYRDLSWEQYKDWRYCNQVKQKRKLMTEQEQVTEE